MADKDKIDTKEASGTFGELKSMVTTYAKQETVEPLKNLGKWAGLGVGGGLMLVIGGFLTSLGVLRLLQKMSFLSKEEGGVSVDTAWTFLPYVIVFALLVIAAGLCVLAATRTPDWMEDD